MYGARNIIQCARGKNIIFSSGCKDYMEQRTPWDVINIGCVLGLPEERAQAAISANPELALKHGKTRRVFKSIIAVSDTD